MVDISCVVTGDAETQGSRSGPDDAGAYAGADEGAGPTPQSLHDAGELIEAHVNRLAAPRHRSLDEVDRRVLDAGSSQSWQCQCLRQAVTQAQGGVRRQGWQASYGLVNLYKDGSECTGSHSGGWRRLTCADAPCVLPSIFASGVYPSFGALPRLIQK